MIGPIRLTGIGRHNIGKVLILYFLVLLSPVLLLLTALLIWTYTSTQLLNIDKRTEWINTIINVTVQFVGYIVGGANLLYFYECGGAWKTLADESSLTSAPEILGSCLTSGGTLFLVDLGNQILQQYNRENVWITPPRS